MKPLLIVLGFICVALGVVGAFLPLLPTTPFILLAAFLFSKSSDRFYQWLIQTPAFGPLIEQWNEHGSVSIKAKIASSTMIGAALIYLWLQDHNLAITIIVTVIMVCSSIYVLTRPTAKKPVASSSTVETTLQQIEGNS